MSQLWAPLTSGHFGSGLNDGVLHFIGSLARKAGFPAQDIDQAQVANAVTTEPVAAPTAAAEPVRLQSTSPQVTKKLPSAPRPFLELTNQKRSHHPAKTKTSSYINTAEDDADEAEEVELVLTLPLAERPPSSRVFGGLRNPNRARAIELGLVSTHAGLGDQIRRRSSRGDFNNYPATSNFGVLPDEIVCGCSSPDPF